MMIPLAPAYVKTGATKQQDVWMVGWGKGEQMGDGQGFFVTVVLILFAVTVFFVKRDLRFRGFVILGLTALAVVTLVRDRVTELAISYKEVKVRLDRIETRLQDVAAAMETLVVAQQITKLENGNTIVLDYDPVPQSVRIIVGPIVHFPRAEYGYRLEGRRIVVEDSQTMNQINPRLPDGVTVEYLRRIKSQ